MKRLSNKQNIIVDFQGVRKTGWAGQIEKRFGEFAQCQILTIANFDANMLDHKGGIDKAAFNKALNVIVQKKAPNIKELHLVKYSGHLPREANLHQFLSSPHLTKLIVNDKDRSGLLPHTGASAGAVGRLDSNFGCGFVFR